MLVLKYKLNKYFYGSNAYKIFLIFIKAILNKKNTGGIITPWISKYTTNQQYLKEYGITIKTDQRIRIESPETNPCFLANCSYTKLPRTYNEERLFYSKNSVEKAG